MPELPRLRKAVIAVRDLDAVARRLRAKLGLEAPFADPGAEQFGLRGAVFEPVQAAAERRQPSVFE